MISKVYRRYPIAQGIIKLQKHGIEINISRDKKKSKYPGEVNKCIISFDITDW